MTNIAKQAIISGKVQRVWYRAWTVKTAIQFGLTGWVRNLSDGSVEALFEGSPKAIEQMLAVLWDGPPEARVDGVEITEAALSGSVGFEQRPTI